MKNERNLLVKALIKNEILVEEVKYAKMYSNILKDGSLRVKLYYLYVDGKYRAEGVEDVKVIEKLKKKLEKLNIGKVNVVKIVHYGKPSYSLAVYVNKDEIA